jgi:hypothetical protein
MLAPLDRRRSALAGLRPRHDRVDGRPDATDPCRVVANRPKDAFAVELEHQMVGCWWRGHHIVTFLHRASVRGIQARLHQFLTGVILALGLGGLSPEPVQAMTLEESVDRFSQCGHLVGEQTTVYAVDGSPTTFYRVASDQDSGLRELVVYVYSSQDAADDVFHVLATVERFEGLDPTPENGPLLERGAGRSVWRENVAVAQVMPMTAPTDLDALPDADLVRCLDAI